MSLYIFDGWLYQKRTSRDLENHPCCFLITNVRTARLSLFIDSFFRESQFLLEEVRKPNRFDTSAKKGGLLIFLKKDVPSRCLQSFHLPEDTPAILFEISLKQRKLFVVTIHRPDLNLDYFLSSITGGLEYYLQHYKDFFVLGDFNEGEHNRKLQSFLSQQGCKNIIKNKTCFKSSEGSCID